MTQFILSVFTVALLLLAAVFALGLIWVIRRSRVQQRRVTEIIGAMSDITARKQAEETIRESEARYRALFDNAEDSIFIVKGYQFFDCNPKTLELFGCTQEQIIGKSPGDFFPETQPDGRASREKALEFMDLTFQGKPQRFEWQHSRCDGTLFDARVSLSQIEISGQIFLQAFVHDITQLNQAAEESIRRAAELEILAKVSTAMRVAKSRVEIYRILLQQLSELLKAEAAGLVLIDPTSSEAVAELGYGLWEPWQGLRISPDKGINSLVITPGQPYCTNDVTHDPLIYAPQVFGDLNAAGFAPLIANEKTIGALCIGRKTSITSDDMRLLTAVGDMAANAIHRQTLHDDLQAQLKALRETQARLVQSEKLAAIGELVAGVAHELNNPLTTIILYAQLSLQRQIEAEIHRDLNKILAESRRAANIVRGLIDFARQRTPERRPIQINDVLKGSLDFLAYELAAHTIHWEIQPAVNLPIIMADPYQLNQVIVNLINNAWQAMATAHGQGQLKIITETGRSIFRVDDTEAAPVIRMIFQDDGPGIPPDVLPHIFDPFFTTKGESEGTGLGLSICHGIISEHGGHIWAESEPGIGAAFFIELPIVLSEQTEWLVDEGVLNSPDLVRPGRLLVIDDEVNVLDVVSNALQRKGYAVDTAKNGAEGLALLSKAHYDLILCDIRMPGMSGPEFYRQAADRDPQLIKRVLFTSGDTISKASRRFLEESGASLLAKPFELNDLIERVHLALAEQPETT
jgi:PAS domain S-box-containing protein